METPKPEATKTISRVCADGTMIELLYDPVAETTSLAVGRPDGSVSIERQVDLPNGERLVPYSATNNLIARGCVLLPSDIGEDRDKGDLVDDIRAYLHRYVDLSPAFEDIAPYYVLLSWVHDAFNELPYLRFRGDYGTGKTRALLAVGSISYKPFFASGASTVSPIFHVLDAFGGTLILDEADFRFSDATSELVKVLNNGNVKGLPVLRTMTNRHRELNPTAFRVYGPKIIAMRESFSDPALESRFLTEETGGRVLRGDIPIHLPDSLAVEAREIRNKLLAWRFRARGSIAPDPSRLIDGVEARVNQTALAILSLIDDPLIRARVRSHIASNDADVRNDRGATEEALVLAALVETFDTATAAHAPVAGVTAAYNRKTLEDFQLPVSPKWVGSIIRTRLHLRTVRTHGVYVVPQSERVRINALAARYGIPSCASGSDPQPLSTADCDFPPTEEGDAA
jgi:hypothetical protein